MDFSDLGWLLFGAGILAGGIGLCLLAFTGRDIADGLHRLAAAIRNRSNDREEW